LKILYDRYLRYKIEDWQYKIGSTIRFEIVVRSLGLLYSTIGYGQFLVYDGGSVSKSTIATLHL
jgi:hypothetical protein